MQMNLDETGLGNRVPCHLGGGGQAGRSAGNPVCPPGRLRWIVCPPNTALLAAHATVLFVK